MPADQNDIYYLTGESRALIEHAPTLEVFRSRGWDVLLMTDPIDEFILPSLQEYRGKHLKAADKGDVAGGETGGRRRAEEVRSPVRSDETET